jgi:hypothetical protein
MYVEEEGNRKEKSGIMNKGWVKENILVNGYYSK